ncbi:MAG: hypothetical protein ACRETB_08760 [Steroidobacteraceae bacterium]
MKVAAITLCLTALCLAACSPSGRLGAWIPRGWLVHRPAPRVALRQPVAPSQNPNMVRAAGNATDAEVPIEVRFVLRDRPEIGKPTELDLELIPSAPLDRIITSFYATPGLSLASGAQAAEIDRPEPGVPIEHTLQIVAQRDGIFSVTATVLADSSAGSVGRTFTIPIIAGAGTP